MLTDQAAEAAEAVEAAVRKLPPKKTQKKKKNLEGTSHQITATAVDPTGPTLHWSASSEAQGFI